MRKRTRLALGAITLLLLWGEWTNWRASRSLTGSATGGSEAVLVLGYRNGGDRANAMNRWRVRAGLRSLDPGAAGTRLILAGGACAGPRSEAALMADYATGARGYRGELVLEEQSRSTWQNIAFAVPYLVDVDQIKIVSLPVHAAKARRYLARQRPDLAHRLTRGAEYRFGEWMPLKPLVTLYALVKHGRTAHSVA
ncbi:YdcF family protein [Nocardia flavorosea]|uniref:YdcF family protein n=1 Tax=Nocardia flavorosea TaxID=53429 RepID=UPI001894BB3F|nr:YdcF family protein [Nocardia flavorosea]MBF6351146.1 YdcF family protein [Nocardia flavorosea]